jgi:multidrug efflux pump subunit AcrA (membrane-fusion protein)
MTPHPATIVLRLAALIFLVASCFPVRILAADAPAAPPAVTVSQPIQRELAEWDEYTGQFAAKEYVEIRARVSGYLTEIHFVDGQIVKEGDLLFVIDPRPYEATLAAARAQLAQANAQVDLATQQLNRSAELRKKDFEPASNYDQRVSDLKVATAATESTKAAIRSAELNVGFTRITAPLTGRISNHQVSVGADDRGVGPLDGDLGEPGSRENSADIVGVGKGSARSDQTPRARKRWPRCRA